MLLNGDERERSHAEGKILADAGDVPGVDCFALSIWLWAKRVADAVCEGVLGWMRWVECGKVACRLKGHERCDGSICCVLMGFAIRRRPSMIEAVSHGRIGP